MRYYIIEAIEFIMRNTACRLGFHRWIWYEDNCYENCKDRFCMHCSKQE